MRECVGDLPAVLFIALGYVAGSIATGFFGAIGTDAYNKAKEKLKSILKTKTDPTIRFSMNYKNVEINISCNAPDEKAIEKIFDTIIAARDLAIQAIDDDDSPTITELNIDYEKQQFTLSSAQNQQLKVNPMLFQSYTYDKVNKKWTLVSDYSLPQRS